MKPPTLDSGRVAVSLILAERTAPFRQIPDASHTPPNPISIPSITRIGRGNRGSHSDSPIAKVIPGPARKRAAAPMCGA